MSCNVLNYIYLSYFRKTSIITFGWYKKRFSTPMGKSQPPKTDRQHNGQNKNYKKSNNGSQQHHTKIKTGWTWVPFSHVFSQHSTQEKKEFLTPERERYYYFSYITLRKNLSFFDSDYLFGIFKLFFSQLTSIIQWPWFFAFHLTVFCFCCENDSRIFRYLMNLPL